MENSTDMSTTLVNVKTIDPMTTLKANSAEPDQSNDNNNTVMIVILVIVGVVCIIAAVLMIIWRRNRNRRYRAVSKAEEGQEGDVKRSSSRRSTKKDQNEEEVVPMTVPTPIVSEPVPPPDTVKDEELLLLVAKLTGRHCRRLVDALGSKFALRKTVDLVIEENGRALFDTKRMLRVWVEEQTGTAEQTRRILKECAEKTGRGDLEDFKHIGDDELRQIVQRMDNPSIANNACETLGVKYEYGEGEEDLMEKLVNWRNGDTQGRPIAPSNAELYRKYMAAVKVINVSSTTSTWKRNVAVKSELFEVAVQLFLQDVRPFAEFLGIEELDLVNYRKQYAEKYSDDGTIYLLKELKLKEGDDWERMCRALRNLGYFDVAHMGLTGNYQLD